MSSITSLHPYSVTARHPLVRPELATEAFALWAAGDTTAGDVFQQFATANAAAVRAVSGGRVQRHEYPNDGFAPTVAGIIASVWQATTAAPDNELIANGASTAIMYAAGGASWRTRARAMVLGGLSEPWMFDAAFDGCALGGADMFAVLSATPLETLTEHLIEGLAQLELAVCPRPLLAPTLFAKMPEAVLAITGASPRTVTQAAARIISLIPEQTMEQARLSWMANMDVEQVAAAAWPELPPETTKTMAALAGDNPEQFLLAALDAATTVTK